MLHDDRADIKLMFLVISLIIFFGLVDACQQKVYGHDDNLPDDSMDGTPIPVTEFDSGFEHSDSFQSFEITSSGLSESSFNTSKFIFCEDETKPKFYIVNVGSLPTEEIYEKIVIAVSGMNRTFFEGSNNNDSFQVPNIETDSDCNIVVHEKTEIIDYGGRDRKIIHVGEANVCGMARIFPDTRVGNNNQNNASSSLIINYTCLMAYVFTHEIVHSIGGVQLTSPSSDNTFHDLTKGDVMVSLKAEISSPCLSFTLDCFHDSYYDNSAHPQSEYLNKSWNTANSIFLQTVHRNSYYFPVFVVN